jgi:prepilin-type N-terminal cleavage/methylation domain-containing protein
MRQRDKAGFSLVEIMTATVILAVLAVGSAAILANTGVIIRGEKNKRMAVERANERLELIRQTSFSDLEPPQVKKLYYLDADSDGTSFVRDNDGKVIHYSSNPGDTIEVNGVDRSIDTALVLTNFVTGTSTVGFVQATVTITHNDATGEDIQLQSIVLDEYITQ